MCIRDRFSRKQEIDDLGEKLAKLEARRDEAEARTDAAKAEVDKLSAELTATDLSLIHISQPPAERPWQNHQDQARLPQACLRRQDQRSRHQAHAAVRLNRLKIS